MKIIQIFENYINLIKTKRVETTVDTYIYKLNMVKKYLKYTDSECVTKEVAQKFIDTLAEQYSTKTVRGLYDVVNAAFRLAYSDGLIKENPFEDCFVNQVIPHEPVILSSEQVDNLLEAANCNYALYIPILIGIQTGLRRSQILGLVWGDISFSDSTISVSKNVIHSKSHRFTEGKEHQKRVIMMSDKLATVLLNLKNYRRSLGIDTGANDFICLTSTYNVMEPTYFNKLFRKFVNNLEGIPHELRFHDLRWNYIRNEVLANKDPKMIANNVGHKSCVFTMDYYCRYKHTA